MADDAWPTADPAVILYLLDSEGEVLDKVPVKANLIIHHNTE